MLTKESRRWEFTITDELYHCFDNRQNVEKLRLYWAIGGDGVRQEALELNMTHRVALTLTRRILDALNVTDTLTDEQRQAVTTAVEALNCPPPF